MKTTQPLDNVLFVHWRCPYCPHHGAAARDIPVKCSKCNAISEPREDSQPLSFVTKSKNYLRERRKWIAAGRPLRDQEEVDKNRNICKGCDKLVNGTCRLCGCPVIRPYIWGDKLTWGTAECPDKPPKWLATHLEN